MELSELPKLLMPYVSGLVILCFSVLWLVSQFVLWLRNPTNHEFPFEPLIATLSGLGVLILIPGLKEQDWGLSWVIFFIALVVLIWVMRRLVSIRDWRFWTVISAFVFVNMLLFWNHYTGSLSGETITVMLQTEPEGKSIDNQATRTWEREIADEFEKNFGVNVEIIPIEIDVNKRLDQFLEQLNTDHQANSTDEVDVFAIDVIWPGIMAKYAEDLKPKFEKFSHKFNPKIFENNRVITSNGSKLVAMPWFVDAGLLFYRKDLLKKYFPDNPKPPETWEELEKKAKIIQDGERKLNKEFWGFVWANKSPEGLTCNALEWQFSYGGGKIVKIADRTKNVNSLDIDIQETANAFEQTKDWIYKSKISPQLSNTSGDRENFRIWRKGNAAFMRNWSYAYNQSFEENPDFPDLRGNVGVTLLPKGNGEKASHASTLGGWQLMINANSQGKEKKAAIKFVEFLISKNIQESLALKTGKVPALQELYKNAKVVKKLPFLDNDEDNPYLKNFFTNILDNTVQRPSAFTGRSYPRISEAYSDEVYDILRNNVRNTETSVEILRDHKIKRYLASGTPGKTNQ